MFGCWFCFRRKLTSCARHKSLRTRLRALSTDAAGKLDVLGHDGHSLGVDGGKVGVLEKTHEVSLG